MKGFTLIELLIVVAVMGLLIKIALPSFEVIISQTGVADAATSYAQTLRRAESYATAGRGDSGWGVKLATSSIVLFKGASYASRDSSYDDQYTPNTGFLASGVLEVDFVKFTGLPNTTGTTTLTDIQSSITKTVYINAKGTITY